MSPFKIKLLISKIYCIRVTEGAMSTKLQITTTHTYDSEECAAAYAEEPSSLIDDKVLCAGRPGLDSCRVI